MTILSLVSIVGDITNFILHVETVFNYLLSSSFTETCQHDIHKIVKKGMTRPCPREKHAGLNV